MSVNEDVKGGIRISARLCLLAACCGLLVSTANEATRQQIEGNQQAFEYRQLLTLTGRQDLTINRVPGEEPARFVLRESTGVVGYIVSAETRAGYNGRISLWLGISNNGELLGVRVRQHQETPGLGDRIDRSVSDWILGFEGQSLLTTRFDLKRDGGDFDQFTGATITPRAVVHAVRESLTRFDSKRETWLLESGHGR